jgi:hypothetical protein
MATVLVENSPYDTPFGPRGWSGPARRRPTSPGHSFYIASTIEVASDELRKRRPDSRANAVALARDARRAQERRSLVFDAVLTALGVKPRRYPQTPEERLERSLRNVARDRDRAGH